MPHEVPIKQSGAGNCLPHAICSKPWPNFSVEPVKACWRSHSIRAVSWLRPLPGLLHPFVWAWPQREWHGYMACHIVVRGMQGGQTERSALTLGRALIVRAKRSVWPPCLQNTSTWLHARFSSHSRRDQAQTKGCERPGRALLHDTARKELMRHSPFTGCTQKWNHVFQKMCWVDEYPTAARFIGISCGTCFFLSSIFGEVGAVGMC